MAKMDHLGSLGRSLGSMGPPKGDFSGSRIQFSVNSPPVWGPFFNDFWNFFEVFFNVFLEALLDTIFHDFRVKMVPKWSPKMVFF